MESASSAARDNGQQQVQEPAPDVEGEPPTGVSMTANEARGPASWAQTPDADLPR